MDVTNLFTDLRDKISDVLSQTDINPALNEVMQEVLRQAISEYDLSSGYTVQNIKKTAFDVQSKHGTAVLDHKKASIAYQTIFRRC